MTRIEQRVEDPFSPDNYGTDGHATDAGEKLPHMEEPLTPKDEPSASEPDDEGFVHTKSFEAPGIIIDEFSGKQWAVPSGTFDDNIKLYHSPYDFKKDPRFHYQVHTFKEVAEMEAQDFVKVTRREVEGDNYREPEAGAASMDSYYTIGGENVAMKIPVELANRRYAANKRLCDAAVQATEPKTEKEKEAILERRRQKSFTKEGYRI